MRLLTALRPVGWQRRFQDTSAQALVEFVFMAMMLIVLVFGLIDFGRAIYDRQILINLSREAANLSSRGTSLADTMTAINASAAPLDLTQDGYLILTIVQRDDTGKLTITDQLAGGALPQTSRVGTGVGNGATLPATDVEIPPRTKKVYVAEVYHRYAPITPLGQLLGFAMPSTPFMLSDVAYF